MRAIVIIPARGGSLGVIRKNLRTVAERPLVVRAVETALGAACVAQVVVSSDDREILARAAEAGATPVLRPAALAGAAATSESAVLHALEVLEGSARGRAELVCMMQCTTPFTTPADLDGAVAQLIDERADSSFTACVTHDLLWSYDAAAGWRGVNHDRARRARRQDRPREVRENGAFYLMREAGFRASGHRFFGRVSCYEMPVLRSLEIDSEPDLALAQAVASVLGERP